MSETLEKTLEKLGEYQSRHYKSIVSAAILITLFMAYGLQNIRMETDITKELPDDIPVSILQKEVSETFGGYDAVFVVIQLDYGSTQKNAVKDIRDPRVIKLVADLEDLIKDEKNVDKTFSAAQLFKKTGIPNSTQQVTAILERFPEAKKAFNKDYSSTTIQVLANLGTKEETVKHLTSAIEKDISSSPVPPGVKVTVTGMPPIRVVLMDTLQSDAAYTISIAAIVILAILLIVNTPKIKGVLIFLPLIFGLIWTLGTMGWLNIPLAIATVGVGAMILGLGVEYGVFYVERYTEEREYGRSQSESLKNSLREVGGAIVGSSTTTVVGFLSLLLASLPMLHHLGTTLALGIIYCVIAALIVNPALIVLWENLSHKKYGRSQSGGGK